MVVFEAQIDGAPSITTSSTIELMSHLTAHASKEDMGMLAIRYAVEMSDSMGAVFENIASFIASDSIKNVMFTIIRDMAVAVDEFGEDSISIDGGVISLTAVGETA